MQRIVKIAPSAPLCPYIAAFVIDEKTNEGSYKVFPGTSLVAGFQFKGRLSVVSDNATIPLATAGITGLSDTYKVFKNSSNIGSVLVLFSEMGTSAFFDAPAHELFKGSYSLENFIAKSRIAELEEQLNEAHNDIERISIVERFFLSLLKTVETDMTVLEAIRLIRSARGNIRMLRLADELNISKSRMEKRFRAVVGATPKKFASVVRFNAIINDYRAGKDLYDLAFGTGYFDQAHFIKSFKSFTGLTPEQYRSNGVLQ